MKAKPSSDTDANRHDARIDAALRAYGRAVPEPGLESRVAARISAMPTQPLRSRSFNLWSGAGLTLLRGISLGALAVAVAIAIVVGTVRHTHQLALPQAARATHSGGMSTAEGTHIPTRAVPQSPTIDPQAPRPPAHGRATISRDQARKATGASVPQSPYPPN